MIKLLTTILAISAIQPVWADKLPFDVFAYQEIQAGVKDESDQSVLLNGIGRCMGALLAAGESGATEAINFDEPDGDAIKAYTGFIQLAVPYQLRYYNVEDSPDIDYSPYVKETEESAIYYAQAYLGWFERDAIDPTSLSNRHPYMIELNKCLEGGLDFHKYYQSVFEN